MIYSLKSNNLITITETHTEEPVYNNSFTFKGVASFLVFLNATINPFIYTFLSSKFKENFLNTVKW